MVRENSIATAIVDAAYKIHKAIGPGLLESAYEAIFKYELEKRDHIVLAQEEPLGSGFALCFLLAYPGNLKLNHSRTNANSGLNLWNITNGLVCI